MVRTSQWLWIVLVSSGVLLVGLLVGSWAPLVIEWGGWSTLVSYLRPPYLYVVINLIIITIAASSRFHRDRVQSDTDAMEVIRFESDRAGQVSRKVELTHYDEGEVSRVEEKAVSFSDFEEKNIVMADEKEEAEEFVISKSTWTPPTITSVSPEKPLVSARFAHRKPSTLAVRGGRGLKVSKPQRHETLESTWKAITEGRPMPLTRHLKRSDTWETHIGQENMSPLEDPTWVKKSETFKDRTNYDQSTEVNSTPPSSLRLRKEPSLSQDELNKRVEAFINKFNEEMRLQRQQSLNQYKEMVGI